MDMSITRLDYLEDIAEDVNYLRKKIYKKVKRLLESIEKNQDPARTLANIVFLLSPKIDIVQRDLVWSNMAALPGVKLRFIAEFMGKPVDNAVAIVEIFDKEGSLDPNKHIIFGKEVSILFFRLIKIEDTKEYGGSLYDKLSQASEAEV